MRRKYFLWAVVGTLMIGLVSGCNIDQIDTGDIQVPNHKGNFGVSVGTATYTMREFIDELQDSSLVIEEDNNLLLKVIYRDSTVFDNVDEILVIDDVSNPGRIEPGIDINSSVGSQEINHDEPLQFNHPISQNEELDSIVYNSGNIRLDIQSDFTVAVEYSFIIDDIVDRSTGQPIVFSGTLNGGGSISQNFSLANHRTTAERVGTENIFTGTFSGTLLVNDEDNVQSDQSLSYQMTIENVEFQTVYGYFGQKTFGVENQTIEMKFFEGIDAGGFAFKNPELVISVDNYIGTTMGLDLSGISSSNADGQTLSLGGRVTDNFQFVRAPGINSVGSSLLSAVKVNNENSTLQELLNISPNQITLEISATSNFNVDDPAENRNFVTHDGKADIIVELEMPLDVRLQGFSRNFDFEMDSIDVSDADTVHLLITSINQMPFNGTVDLQLIDPSETILYEFQNILLIQSPELPPSGRAETPMVTPVDIKLFDESLQAFLNTTKLNLIMSVDSYNAENNSFVKIFSDYQLELKVAVEANLNKEL